ERPCSVGALGGGVVPVVDPVGGVAGVVVHGDAAGGVGALPWGVQGAEVTVDRDSFGTGPGGWGGRQGAMGDDRQVAFCSGAVVEDEGDAVGMGADRARGASQVAGMLWVVQFEQASGGVFADGAGARQE